MIFQYYNLQEHVSKDVKSIAHRNYVESAKLSYFSLLCKLYFHFTPHNLKLWNLYELWNLLHNSQKIELYLF